MVVHGVNSSLDDYASMSAMAVAGLPDRDGWLAGNSDPYMSEWWLTIAVAAQEAYKLVTAKEIKAQIRTVTVA